MNRRDQLVLLCSSLGWPASFAQPARADGLVRIGLFPGGAGAHLDEIREGFLAAGWREGGRYVFVASDAGYGDVSMAAARRLVDQQIDVVLVVSTAHALAFRQVTTRIPIVMLASGYPVEAGLANSLARPGKNVTGMTTYAGTDIWGKLLELLRDSKPGIRRIAVAWGYVPPTFPREEIEPAYQELRRAARSMGVVLHLEEIPERSRVPKALASLAAAAPDALLITAGPGFFAERQRVMQFANSRRLPTAADWRWPSGDESQPMLVLSQNFAVNQRRAADFIVRIIDKGDKAGDLPIEQPSRLELVINRKTAKAIGLTLPRALLVRADETID